MTFYAPPDQIDQVDYAKDVGVRMLDYMEDYFSIDYPLPKAGKHNSSYEVSIASLRLLCFESFRRALV